MNFRLFDAVAREMKALRIGRVFGIPGTQTVRLYESFRRAGLSCTLTAHEAGAAFAAAAWYRSGAGLAAASVIPGPGFTNALTGVAEAQHDSAAMLLITEAPIEVPNRSYSLQAIHHQHISESLMKGCFRIANRENAADLLREAADLACAGEPGPVLIELGGAEDLRPTQVEASNDWESLISVVSERLSAARRPIIFCGQGAAAAAEQVRVLVERLRCPIFTTTSGRGLVSESDPRNIRFECVSGGVDALNQILGEADLILALGCKFSHNGSAGFEMKLPVDQLIRVDSDGDKEDCNYPASIFVESRCEHFLARLLETFLESASEWTEPELAKHKASVVSETQGKLAHRPLFRDAPDLDWPQFFGALRTIVEDDAVVVTDSGNHQVLTRAYWEVRLPRTFLVPTDFQSMGFALPTALAAGLANPARQVVVVMGDGGLAMAGMEFATLLRAGLRVTLVLFNDGLLGQIDAMQAGYSGVSFNTDVPTIDWEQWARALGCAYTRLGPAAGEALESAFERPGILEVRLEDSDELNSLRRKSRIKHPIKRVIQR